MLTPRTVKAIFEIFQKNNHAPETELIYHNAFELLIAVVLSAQSTDKAVNRVTQKLFTVANSAQKILDLGEAQLREHIKTLGLFNTKAKNIIKTCEILVAEYNGEVPKKRLQLQMLAGVGRKTANVLLNTLYGEATIAVDTHIFRVAHRLDLSQGNTPEKVEHDLMQIIPKKYLKNAHHWLVLHGRYICQARRPKCDACPINQYCITFTALAKPLRQGLQPKLADH
jgi:endonuclease-3